MVFFFGCEVAKGERGWAFLEAAAKVMGVKAIGCTGAAYPIIGYCSKKTIFPKRKDVK